MELRAGLNHSTSMSLFREIRETFDLSSYLLKFQNRKQRNAITKLRLSSHSLFIETGRHTGVARENRKCTLCKKKMTNSISFSNVHFIKNLGRLILKDIIRTILVCINF